MLFGWPDLYGFGDYCLMGNATSQLNPAGINDFYRADQGWIPQIDVDASTNTRFSASSNGGGFRYTNPARKSECYFWSNVQNTGRFKVLRGNGILVLHFDKSIGNNDPPNPLSLDVIEADGRTDLSATMWPSPGSAVGDFFVQGRNAMLSDTTTPRARWNDGSATGLKLYEVSASGPRMTFAVGVGSAPADVMDGGAPLDAGTAPMQPNTMAGAGGAAGSGAAGGRAAGGSPAAGSGASAGTAATPPSVPPPRSAAAGSGTNAAGTRAVGPAAIADPPSSPAGTGASQAGNRAAAGLPTIDASAASTREQSGCTTTRLAAGGGPSTTVAPLLALLAVMLRRRIRRAASNSRL